MAIIVQDQFADSDGVSLDAHTPNTAPSGGWTERSGNWQITSNAAVLAGNNNNGHATIETGAADCTITVEADNNSGSAALGTETGIIARWSDVNNYWRIGINAAGDTLQIIERNGGTNTSRASASVTITPGTLYTVQVVLSGATITATLDGGNEISYGSATLNQTATVHGIAGRNGTSDRVDDFLVETAASGPDYTLTVEAGSYVLTGQAATLKVARRLTAEAGSYTLTGQDVTLTYTPNGGPDYTLTAEAGSYSLSGQSVSLIVSRVLAADAGAYTLTGQAANLLVGRLLAADAGSYTVTGQDATLLVSRLLSAGAGSYTITGRTVTLVYSGEEPTITPASRVYVVPAEDRVFVIVAEDRTFAIAADRRVLGG